MSDLTGWPIGEYDAYICNKLHPMPEKYKSFLPKGVKWVHEDAEETGVETETLVEYKCPNCGWKFMIYLGG